MGLNLRISDETTPMKIRRVVAFRKSENFSIPCYKDASYLLSSTLLGNSGANSVNSGPFLVGPRDLSNF
jgi:hypothetical protein